MNAEPVFDPIEDKSVNVNSLLAFTVTASDHDEPSNTLTYQLIDAPAGAGIDSETGQFIWRPTESQGGKLFAFKIQVSDGKLIDEQELSVKVNYNTSSNIVIIPEDNTESDDVEVLVN